MCNSIETKTVATDQETTESAKAANPFEETSSLLSRLVDDMLWKVEKKLQHIELMTDDIINGFDDSELIRTTIAWEAAQDATRILKDAYNTINQIHLICDR